MEREGTPHPSSPYDLFPHLPHPGDSRIVRMLTVLNEALYDFETIPNREVKQNAETLFNACLDWFKMRQIPVALQEPLHQYRVQVTGGRQP
jgi:hypothetical protein